MQEWYFLQNAQFFSEKIHLLFGTLLGKCAALLAGNLQKIVFVSCQFYADQQNFIKCVVVMRTTSENNPTKFHNNNNIPTSSEGLQFLSRDVFSRTL